MKFKSYFVPIEIILLLLPIILIMEGIKREFFSRLITYLKNFDITHLENYGRNVVPFQYVGVAVVRSKGYTIPKQERKSVIHKSS